MGRDIRALTGVRGIAIALVLLSHVSESRAALAGAAGVVVFFVLSGFLITSILARQLDPAGGGRVRYAEFYWRRAVRLFPALLLLLALTPVAMWLVGDPTLDGYAGGVWASLLYLRDFGMAGIDLPLVGPIEPNLHNHLWSLGVEEQFYLVWPLAIAAIFALGGDERAVRRRVYVLTGVALAWHLLATAWLSPERVAFGPDTNAYALLLGCSLAFAVRERGLRTNGPLTAVLAAGLLLVPVAVTVAVPASGDARNLLMVPVALAGVALVLFASGVRWLELRPLVYLGEISYGLYLWHATLLFLLPDGRAFAGAERLVVLVLSVGVAAASYHLVEQPLRRRYRNALSPAAEGEAGVDASPRGAVSPAASR